VAKESVEIAKKVKSFVIEKLKKAGFHEDWKILHFEQVFTFSFRSKRF
jgi:hypothetical protein